MAHAAPARSTPQVNCGLVGVGTVGSAALDFFAHGPLEMRLSGPLGRLEAVPIHVWSASRRSRHNPKGASEERIRRVLQSAGGEGTRFFYDADPSDASSRFRPGRPSWREIVSDPEVDIVVELTGSPVAEAIIEEALWNGKCVVTANKKVMSRSGYELVRLAESRGAVLAYEAAVGGGMPIVQTIGTSIGGRIESLLAIINGTCNFMLSMMGEAIRSGGEGDVYPQALSAAMEAGLAEADPSDDVLGEDARSKLIILAGLAFGVRLRPADVYVRGIARRDRMTQESIFKEADLAVLDRLGLAPKLLAGAQRRGDKVVAWVSPAAVPAEHPLAGVEGAHNACLMQVESPSAVGKGHPYEIMVRGPGAGGPETASSVIADIRFCAHQLAAAGRIGGWKGAGGPPPPVYMYGAEAFHKTQPYGGVPTVLADDGLAARFLVRFLRPAAEDDETGAGAMAAALGESGIEATPVTPAIAAPRGHHYVRTDPVSFNAMERGLEAVIARQKAGRMPLDVLYVPIIDGAALNPPGGQA